MNFPILCCRIFSKKRIQDPDIPFNIWMIAALIAAVVKFMIGKYNNYKIFKGVFWHAIAEQPLYGEAAGYYDSNHYGIIFSYIIAPFAVLPDWFGIILWVVANTALLYYALNTLPLNRAQKTFVYWFVLCELFTAQTVQQFNISVAAFIILAWSLIARRKEFWAAFVIVLGAFIKIYPIVGLAFFFFSKNKPRFIFSGLFWIAIMFSLPLLMVSPQYMISQYEAWFHQLQLKNALNQFAVSQNISLLGLVRKVTGSTSYSDMMLILPALALFFAPYFRIGQFKNLCFRLMLLANVLIFSVLFSTGSEAASYVTAMIGVAIWYLATPSENQQRNKRLMIATLVVVGLCTTELMPKWIRVNLIVPYVIKSWLVIAVWFRIVYDMIFLDFKKSLLVPDHDIITELSETSGYGCIPDDLESVMK